MFDDNNNINYSYTIVQTKRMVIISYVGTNINDNGSTSINEFEYKILYKGNINEWNKKIEKAKNNLLSNYPNYPSFLKASKINMFDLGLI